MWKASLCIALSWAALGCSGDDASAARRASSGGDNGQSEMAAAGAPLIGAGGELVERGGNPAATSAGTGGHASSTFGGAGGAQGDAQCAPSAPPVTDPSGSHIAIEVLRAAPIVAPTAPTSCEHPPSSAGGSSGLAVDACGCSGLDCSDGKTCVRAIVELGAGCGGPQLANQCVQTCAADADCKSGEICLPTFEGNEFPKCFPAACRSSSDCCGGYCDVSVGYRSQCHPHSVLQIACR